MRYRTTDRGFLLLLSLFVLTGLAAIINVGLTRTMTEQLAARQDVATSQAFHLAEAGVDEALRQLNAVPALSLPFDCPAVSGLTLTCHIEDRGNNLARITAEGLASGTRETLEVVVEVPKLSNFQWPLFANDWMQITGWSGPNLARIDSYDSRLGAYGATLSTPHPVYGLKNQSQDGRPISYRASVRTSDTDPNDIAMGFSPPATIYGDVIVGPGADPDTVIYGTGPLVKGQKKSEPAITLPPIELPAGSPPVAGLVLTEANCGAGRTYTVAEFSQWRQVDSGDCNLTVTGSGTIHLEQLKMPGGHLTINGAITLVLHGGLGVNALEVGNGIEVKAGAGRSAHIYVHGAAIIGEGLENETQIPGNFRLYADGPQVSIADQTGAFHGVIYAPAAAVSLLIEENDLYGSVIGNRLTVSSKYDIHYDEALALDPGSSVSQLTIRSWRQLP